MARNTLNYTVTDDGRDHGKVFVLTEMPAAQGEAWAMRALMAMMNEGVQLPDGVIGAGMAGLAEMGLTGLIGLRWEVVEPLLAEMMTCVQFMPDPQRPQILRRLFDDDIEEIPTRIKLRAEVWKLHVGFLMAGNTPNSGGSTSGIKAAKRTRAAPT